MKAMQKQKQKRRGGLFLSIFFCLGLLLTVALRYISTLRVSLLEQSITNVLTVSNQQKEALDNFINEDRERLYSFTEYIAASKSTDVEALQTKMSAYRYIDAYYMVINLETGTYFGNQSSNTYQMDPRELNVLRKLSGSGIRSAYKNVYTDDTMFGYYERFTFADGVPGLFQKSYNSSRLNNEFSLSFYNGQGLAYVVDPEGDILLHSNGMIGSRTYANIFELLADNNGSPEDVAELNAALSRQEMGRIIINAEPTDYLYIYVPMESVPDWHIISIVPMNVIMAEDDQILLNSRNSLFLLAAILAGFALALLLFWHTRREIRGRDLEINYQEQVFRLFTNYLSDRMDNVYMLLDAETRQVDYISRNVSRVLGITPEEIRADIHVLGQTACLQSSFDPAVLDQMEPETSLEPSETEHVNRQTGQHRWFQDSVYCTELLGRRKILIFISDRTQEHTHQHQLSEALKLAQSANTAKSNFLSSISHDIRTPMNAIIGLVTLLREDAAGNPTMLDYIQRIDAASQHLLGLINDVLDINKIESGSATLNICEVRLADLVDELNTIIRPQAAAKGQEFDIFVSDIIHENLLGDKLRINQVLINILSNAVKYTQNGGHIQLRVEELPQTGDQYSHILWTIKDNGMGMSPEYLEVIFEPFSREDTAVRQQIQGTGLGMAITKNLVDLLGASIHVESQLGHGTTFVVEMALRIQECENDSQFWKEHHVSRMLVADDEPDVCQSVVKAMANTGVVTEYATSGQQAIQMARDARERGNPYDLLLLDWKMPDLDGLETAWLIRKHYPERIPILLFTAYDWADIEQEASEIGIHHFMSKPFFLTTFQDRIRQIMGDEKQTQEASTDRFDGLRFLVVDDIEVNRMILVKILKTLGAVCETANNGQEAVEKFEQSAPGSGYDIILMDVQMPVMSGYDATKAIRAGSHPDAKSVPIVAMTANAFTDDIRRAIDSGMDAHIAKPVQLDKLKATIRQVLENRARPPE